MGPLLGPETRHRILFLSRKSLRNCYKAVDLLCDMIRFAFIFFLRCICECMRMCITEVEGAIYRGQRLLCLLPGSPPDLLRQGLSPWLHWPAREFQEASWLYLPWVGLLTRGTTPGFSTWALGTLNEARIAYTVGSSLTEPSPCPLTFYDFSVSNVLRFIDSHTVHLLECAVWFSLACLQCCLAIVTTVNYGHKMPFLLAVASLFLQHCWFPRQPQIYFLFQWLGLT